jgi:hypothetical protein
VQTETASSERPAWRSTSKIRTSPLLQVLDLRLALILTLALLAGALAYQTPPSSEVLVGWLGDRLFLRASEGQTADDRLSFYGDELTDHARSGRSRWTHQGAQLLFPGLGNGDLTVTLRSQGWPEDTLNDRVDQPQVMVEADGRRIGSFTPTAGWDDYRFEIPATVRRGPDLTITLQSTDTFTSTARFSDPRPKGIRVEWASVQGTTPINDLVAPAPAPVAWLMACGALLLLSSVALTRRPTLGFVLATLLVAAVAIGLAVVRAWAAALLPWLAAACGLLLLYAWRADIIDTAARLIRRYARGSAINYGLIAAGASWLTIVAAQASASLRLPGLNAFWDSFPDSLIYGMLGMGLALLVIVRGREGLPHAANILVGTLAHRRVAPVLLALFVGVWVGYGASVIAGMPYVGHADYADNAVVARNLAAGRGWVVDYVTQFYRLYDGVTRPQETWPLLQPVWIAPFFALFGPSNWAAKIPNLLFTIALAVLIYSAGARLWDRRVGLTAAVFILTSYLFFRLMIYVTADLAFVALSFGALWTLYRSVAPEERHGRRWLVASGVLTGLMLLQKPGSGGLIALGMGLWLLRLTIDDLRLTISPQGSAIPITEGGAGRRSPGDSRGSRWRRIAQEVVNRQSPIAKVALWAAIALVIITPYLARNMALFGRPYYSTESKDAWVLEYTGWDDIYKVYTTEGGLSALGAPDATWVLRWGFDRTLTKLGRQVEAVRDYLVPSWGGLPFGLEALGGRSDKTRLLFEMGAWLSLMGVIGAIGGRRRLLSLLLAAFVPYTLFLIGYWHTNEERYWVALMPWLALLGAGALWHGYDRVAAIGDGRWTPLGLVLVVTAIVLVARPSWPDIAEKVVLEPELYAADIDAYTWLRENTEPGAVVMTRAPWQLNWHSERPALMVPGTADQEVMLKLARHYEARYLVFDSLQNPDRATRQLLDRMVADPALGFELVYESPMHAVAIDGRYLELVTEVYRFPDDYGGAPPIRSGP